MLCFSVCAFVNTSVARTFVFKPVVAQALYSDTANWENRQYPGLQIEYGDTIVFESNGNYQHVIIDTNIIVRGYCHVKDSVYWMVPANTNITFQGLLYESIIERERLKANTTSEVTVAGKLFFNGAGATLLGIANISGNIVSDADVENALYQQKMSLKKAVVSGTVSGIGLQLSADSLAVDSSAVITIHSGYNMNGGSLNATFLHNKGKINLLYETQLTSNTIQNSGVINAGAITGQITNDGTIEVLQFPSNGFTANIHDVINTGTIKLYGSIYAPLMINGVNNEGVFQISDYLNEASANTWVTIEGMVLNTNQWIQTGTAAVAHMQGQFANAGSFYINGKTFFNSGIFTNNAVCVFSASTMTPAFQLANEFVNNGTLTFYGQVILSGQLKNYGTLNFNN